MSRLVKFRKAVIWLGGMVALLAGWAIWAATGQPDHDPPSQVAAAAETPGPEFKSDVPSSTAAEPADESSPDPETASEPSTATKKPADQDFEDPQTLARRFSTELGRVVKRGTFPTPAELLQQAEAAKTCNVAVLPDPGRKLSAEAIYARARPSVVIVGAILSGRSQRHKHTAMATGFVIHKDGIIVTNYHVLDAFQHSRAVGVMTEDGRVLAIKAALAADSHNDIAVVKADADNLTPLPIAASVPVGATVCCLSHPALDTEETESAFYAFTQGIVSGKYRLRFGNPTPLNILAITAEYAKGSSGGPVLNEHGAVVGIICQTRALFHDEEETEPQLTWKFSRPSSSLLALLQTPAAPTGKSK